MLARLLRDFDVTLPPHAAEPRESVDVTLKPVGLRLLFTPRLKK
jgi:hypothetical protein